MRNFNGDSHDDALVNGQMRETFRVYESDYYRFAFYLHVEDSEKRSAINFSLIVKILRIEDRESCFV